MSGLIGSVSAFDVREFAGPVRVAARSAPHVARVLEAAFPKDGSPAERTALEQVLAAGEVVGKTLLDREQASPARVRPAYAHFMTMWSILHDLLADLARVPGEVSPRGPRAAALVSEALPLGISFVQLQAAEAWSAAQRRLDLIDKRGLGPEIESLIGPDMLDGVRKATLRLREASGAGPTPSNAPSSTAVAERLATFSQLVGMYCRILAAKVDERDAVTVQRFRKAVAPLAEYRASRRGADRAEEEPEPVGDPSVLPGMPGAMPLAAGPSA
jgi:hypothetical protein